MSFGPGTTWNRQLLTWNRQLLGCAVLLGGFVVVAHHRHGRSGLACVIGLVGYAVVIIGRRVIVARLASGIIERLAS